MIMDGFGKMALPAERETGLRCAIKRKYTPQFCDRATYGAVPSNRQENLPT